MKKILIATFFGVLGLCENNMEASASDDEGDNDYYSIHSSVNLDHTGPTIDDDDIDTEESIHDSTISIVPNVKAILSQASKDRGISDGGDLNTVVEAIDNRLTTVHGINDKLVQKEDRVAIIGVMLSSKNKMFNIFTQILNVRGKNANLKVNLNTIAEILSLMMKGKDGVLKITARDCNVADRQTFRTRFNASAAAAVKKVVGRKETSKDQKLGTLRDLLTKFTVEGIDKTTNILEKIGETDWSKVAAYVNNAEEGGLKNDVESIEEIIKNLKFEIENGRSRAGVSKEPNEVKELRTALLELLKALKLNVQQSLSRIASGSKEGLCMLIRYLHTLSVNENEDQFKQYMGLTEDSKLRTANLLYFYVQAAGGYNDVDRDEIERVNEQLKDLLEDAEMLEKVRNWLVVDKENPANTQINEADWQECERLWNESSNVNDMKDDYFSN